MGNNIANVAQQQNTLAIETQNGTKQIQLYDEATGDMKNTYQILEQIAGYWDEMNNAQKQAIGIALAGKNQFEVFASVEEGFADAQKAVTLATDSENSALNENSKYMDSISARANLARAQLQELVLGDGGLTDLVKVLLTATTALLKFANSGVGKAIITTTALVVAFNSLSKLMKTDLVTGIVGFIANLATMIVNEGLATTAGYGLLAVLTEISAMEKSTAIGLIIGAVALLTVGIGKLTDKLITTREEAQESYNEAMNQLNDASGKIKQINQQLDELNNKEATLTDPNDIANLEIERQQLEAQLEIQKQQYETAKRQAQLDAEKVAKADVTYASFGEKGEGTSFDATGRITTGQTLQGDATTALKEQTETITALTAKIAELTQAREELGNMNAILAKDESDLNEQEKAKLDQYNEINGAIDANAKVLQANQDASVENAQALQQLVDSHTDLNGKVDETVSVQQDVLNAWTDSNKGARGVTSALKEQGDTAVITEQDIEGLSEGLDENASTEEDVAKAYDNAVSSISSMSDQFGTLNDAVSEYNSTGALSLDTISDLLAMDSEYLSLLQMENGQMSLNQDGALALANAKIDDAEATAIQEAQTELATIKDKQYNDTLVETASASSVAVISAQSAGQAILTSGKDAITASEAWADAWSVISQGYSFTSKEDKAYSKQVEDSLKNRIVTLESLRGNIGKVTTATGNNTKSTNKGTSATKKNTDALKDNLEALKKQKEALEEQKGAYDDVISYIENKLEDAIDDLEEKRDKELEYLEEDYEAKKESVEKQIEVLEKEQEQIEENTKAEIEALEKQKDAEDERVNSLIDGLKDAQKAEEEYWDNKINALKDANSELQDQIELEQLLDSLEQAKSTKKMVYREGSGFVYEQDTEAVSEAEKNLQQYYRQKEYDDALKQLETYKENASKNYDQQIQDLENYIDTYDKNLENQINNLNEYIDNTNAKYEQEILNLNNHLDMMEQQYDAQVEMVKESYQKQIDYYQNWLDKFKEGVSKYEEEQTRQKALFLTGIDFEKEGWENQLKNLDDFVKRYTKLQEQVTEATNKVTEAQKAYNEASSASSSSNGGSSGGSYSSSGGKSSSSGSSTSPYSDMVGKFYTWKKGAEYYNLTTKKSGKTTTDNKHTIKVTEIIKDKGKYWAVYGINKDGNKIKMRVDDLSLAKKQTLHANGTYATKDDEIAIVGDDPKFSELVVGSKLNSGAKVINANKGTGVIPHNLTSTLVSMAQAFQGQSQLQTTNNSNSTNISIGNISLPNVENGEQFVDYLQNFNLDMTSMAYTR